MSEYSDYDNRDYIINEPNYYDFVWDNSTVGEIVVHYFFYDGKYIDEIVVNYLLILLFTIANLLPWSHSMKKNIFVILHELMLIILQILCWTNYDVWGYTFGVALIWCGQVGLMLTWVLCLVKIILDLHFHEV